MQPVKVQYPMEMIAVDIMGPFPQNEHGNCYILVAENYFTKWLEAWVLPNQEAKTVACKLLNEMFYRFSLPDRLHSDQGRQFESKIIKELCKLLQIRKPPYQFTRGQITGKSKPYNFEHACICS